VGLEIVCVERKGKDPAHRHVSAVGVDTSQVIIRFSVKTVRKILKRATVDFYCRGPDGEPVRIRRYRCTCGIKTIRTKPDDVTDGCLSALPTCPRPGQASPATGRPILVVASGVTPLPGAPAPPGTTAPS